VDQKTPRRRKFDRTRLFTVVLGVLIFLALLSPLIAHAVVGTYTRYMADDYCTAYTVKALGLIKSQQSYYSNWSGRYSFTFFINLLELLGQGAAAYLPLITIVAWGMLTVWSVYQYSALFFPKVALPTALLTATLMVFAIVVQIPNFIQTLYWKTGIVTYIFPLLWMTLYAGWIGHLMRTSADLRISWLPVVLSGLLTFILGGFSEITVVFLVVANILLVTGSFWPSFNHHLKRLRPFLISGALGSLLALVVLVLSPGNVVRRSYMPPPPNMIELILVSARYTAAFIYRQFSGHGFASLLSWIAPLVLAFKLSEPGSNSPSGTLSTSRIISLMGATVLLGGLMIFVGFIPPIYGTSVYPPDRALVAYQFWLTLTLMLLGYFSGLLLSKLKIAHWKSFRPAFELLGAALIIWGSFVFTARALDVLPRMQDYASKWERREAQFQEALWQNNMNPVVIPLSHLGGLSALVEDPQDWLNACVANYHGFETISARDQ
jgi:hypothetical protein